MLYLNNKFSEGRGICVNAVCPGFIESDMTKDLDKDAYLANIPLKR